MDPNEQTDIPSDEPAAPTEEQRLEAFQRGLQGKTTETPPSPAATEQEPEPPTEPPAPKYRQITDEEFAALSAAAARVEELRATVEKSNGTAFGKIGGIERRLQELGLQGIKLPKDKLDRLRGDLPEVAELFDSLEAIKAAPVDVEAIVAKKLEENDAKHAERRREEAEDAIAEVHADWKQVIDDPAFHAAVKAKGQAEFDRLVANANAWNWRPIAREMTAFKAAQRKATDAANARRERLDSNIDPRGAPAAAAMPKSREEALMTGFKAIKPG